jgi:peptide/nickel transport system substrate-binding protein
MLTTLKRAAAAAVLAAGLGCGGLAGGAAAQDIAIGLAGAVTSIDPHFHALQPNINVAAHIFDTLVAQDPRQRLIPSLATEWRPLDDTTWEFKLRRGVKFHDGSDFTAEDVVATLRRVPWVPNSPSSFAIYTRPIVESTIVDPYTIRFRTARPYPLLPNDLAQVYIIAHANVEAPTGDFNNGRAAIGTGPYRFVEYVPGDRIVVQRNDTYWGERPHWQRVTLRQISNDAARVAALLAGDIQAIENVPPDAIPRLRGNDNITISQTVSNRLVYLHLDTARDQSPFATDRAGAVLPNNPLKDVRVRRALSMAINRQAIVSRLLDGVAIPAGGLLPDEFFGASPRLTPMPYNPEQARRLLAEAGYPNGFGLTIHGPNDRYIKDEAVLQAIGPMFSRIGIETRVVTMPWATFASQASAPNYSFSVMLVGWGAGTGEVSSPLRSLLATVNPQAGMGASNRGRYSNPHMDEVLAQALATVNDQRREQLLQEASEIAINDVGLIPLHYQINVWAMRRGITYAARTDESTLGQFFRPAN